MAGHKRQPAQAEPIDLVVGVDAGGSRTRAAAATLDGRVFGAGLSGPANSRTGPFDAASSAVQNAVRDALRGGWPGTSGLPAGAADRPLERDRAVRVRAVCIGSAGLEQAGSEAEGRRLLGAAVDAEAVVFDTDAFVAWTAAHPQGPGVVVVAGTGSICLGVDALGRRHRVGGWGPRFGDEGSAYAIARHGIQRALEVLDGRSDDPGSDAALLSELLAHAGLGASEATMAGAMTADAAVPDAMVPDATVADAKMPDVREANGRRASGAEPEAPRDVPLHPTATLEQAARLTAWLYAPDRSIGELAGFAQRVDALADAGNRRALAILEAAGEELAGLVQAAGRPLRAGPSAVGLLPVAVGGGVLRHNERVRDAFDRRLATLGGYRVLDTFPPPVVGSLILALRALPTAVEGAGHAPDLDAPDIETAVRRLREAGPILDAALYDGVPYRLPVQRDTEPTPADP